MTILKFLSRAPEFKNIKDPTFLHEGGMYAVQNAGQSYSFKKTLDGKTRFETRPGDAWPNDYPDNAAIRSEISQRNILSYGVDWWIKYDLIVSETTNTIDASQNILGQVHAADSLGARGPIFSINLEQGNILKIRTAEDRVSPQPPWKYVDRAIINNFELNVKYTFMARMRFGYSNDAQLDFWMRKNNDNLVQILTLTGINMGYMGDDSPYMKWGIYTKPDTSQQRLSAVYKMIGPTKTNPNIGIIDSQTILNDGLIMSENLRLTNF